MMNEIDKKHDENIENDIAYAKHYDGFEVPEEPAPVEYGPYNKEGFLAEERTGLFPEISHDTRSGIYEAVVYATLIDPQLCPVLIRVQASSMDRLRDTWNRRNV
jgi:hypothetical protein